MTRNRNYDCASVAIQSSLFMMFFLPQMILSDNAAKTKLEADVKSMQVKSLGPHSTMINNTTTGKKKSRI